MPITRSSPCKVNLVLNILGRRPDGFHDLETLFFPVPLHDELSFEPGGEGIRLTCSHPDLPVDGSNLVMRAALRWAEASGIREGVGIHLEKRLPLAAGLGAGSANAAVTLLGLNEVFGAPLSLDRLDEIAAGLGSDVNFFLQPHPALATGRGERIQPLGRFGVLSGTALFLFHPGFGVPTPWAFRELADFPECRDGRPGRAAAVADALGRGDLPAAVSGFYNGLEAPVLRKYPILALHQEFLRNHGAMATLMSGSGSTTFALFRDPSLAESVVPAFRAEFGSAGWLATVPL